MAPRKPPTNAELVAAIEEAMSPEQRRNGAIALGQLTSHLRRLLHTVPRRAEIWVHNLATEEAAPVRIFSVTPGGQMDGFLRRSSTYAKAITSKWGWREAFDYSPTSPGGKSLTSLRAPKFDDAGMPNDNPDNSWPEYLIFTDTLHTLMQQAERRTKDAESAILVARRAELKKAHELHGDALDVLRGALQEVTQIAPQDRWRADMRTTHHPSAPDRDEMTMVEFRVANHQIEALAAILRRADVEPVRRYRNNPAEENL